MASNATPKTILLRGNPQAAEGRADTTGLYPGMLVAIKSDNDIIAHPTAKGVAAPNFVREEDYVGGSIDVAYASLDRVPYWKCQKGDEVYAFLETGANVAIGAYLESNGAGYLQALTAGSQTTSGVVTFPGNAVAVALEAVNNSGGGAGPDASARIKVRVL